MEIKGIGNINGEWNIKITNVEVAEESGNGANKNFSFEDTKATLEADLYNKGDYVTYNITVTNNGSFDAKLASLGLTKSTNEAVLITSNGLVSGQTLYKEESITFSVKIEYNSNYVGDASGTTGMADLTLDFVQNSGGTVVPTEDYLVHYDYTTNGGVSTNAEDEYVTTGTAVNLNYTAVKENAEFIGWNTNSGAEEELESLTMPNREITLYAIFKDKDNTPPVIENVSTSSTINSITVVTTATEEDGEINHYEYSIDNGSNWIKVSGTNNYTFTGLTSNTNYKILVRVYNESEKYSEEEVNVSTKKLNAPTFSEKESDNGKIVIISYPEGEGLVYEYQKDSGSWTTATQNQEVEFTESGTLVAKVSDGTNEESSSYSVEVKPNAKNTITELAKMYPSELYTDDYGNIRYYGANPNNYVTFNNELWQIMGVIDGKVKIVKSENIPTVITDHGLTIASSEGFYWNHVQQDNKEFNNWETSTLHMYLNGTYYNSIESNSKDMIAEETYYLGGPTSNNYYEATAKDYYTFERSNSVLSDNPVSIRQNIGLIYPSDYGYASAKDCHSLSLSSYRKEVGSYSDNDCAASNYLYNDGLQWLQTPGSSDGIRAAYIGPVGQVLIYGFNGVQSGEHQVFPSLYLKAKVQIAGGSGTSSDPYRLTF